ARAQDNGGGQLQRAVRTPRTGKALTLDAGAGPGPRAGDKQTPFGAPPPKGRPPRSLPPRGGPPRSVPGLLLKLRHLVFELQFLELQSGDLEIVGAWTRQGLLDLHFQKPVLFRKLSEMCRKRHLALRETVEGRPV